MYRLREGVNIQTRNISRSILPTSFSSAGGAFVGLDKIIKDRLGSKQLGFNHRMTDREPLEEREILQQVQPEDLVRFGLIPEFVGTSACHYRAR